MTNNVTTSRVIYAEYRELRPIPFLYPDGFEYVYFSTDVIAKIIESATRQGISVETLILQAIEEKLNTP